MESKTIVQEGRSLLKKGSLNRRWKNCEFYMYSIVQEHWGCKDLSPPLGGHREELHNGCVWFFPIYHETRCFPSRVDSRMRYYRYDLDRISAASLFSLPSLIFSCSPFSVFFFLLSLQSYNTVRKTWKSARNSLKAVLARNVDRSGGSAAVERIDEK